MGARATQPYRNWPHGRIQLGSDQLNLANDTDIKVLLDEIEGDALDGQYQDGIEDAVNNRITPGVAGLYICFAQITYIAAVIDKLYRASLYRNWGIGGSRIIGANEYVLTYASGVAVVSVHGHCWLDTDDFIELIAYHFAGVGTVDIDSGSISTFLYVQRIR